MDPEDPARKAHHPTTAPTPNAPAPNAAGSPGVAPGAGAVPESPVRELRVAVTVADYEAAVRFYRDVLGLPVIESWDQPDDRRGVILAAGQATLELLSTAQTALVDEVETDQPPGAGEPGQAGAGPPVRLAVEVADSAAAAEALVAAGADRLGGPVVTPWRHRNVRLRAPDGMQLTLFTVLDPDDPQGPAPS